MDGSHLAVVDDGHAGALSPKEARHVHQPRGGRQVHWRVAAVVLGIEHGAVGPEELGHLEGGLHGAFEDLMERPVADHLDLLLVHIRPLSEQLSRPLKLTTLHCLVQLLPLAPLAPLAQQLLGHLLDGRAHLTRRDQPDHRHDRRRLAHIGRVIERGHPQQRWWRAPLAPRAFYRCSPGYGGVRCLSFDRPVTAARGLLAQRAGHPTLSGVNELQGAARACGGVPAGLEPHCPGGFHTDGAQALDRALGVSRLLASLPRCLVLHQRLGQCGGLTGTGRRCHAHRLEGTHELLNVQAAIPVGIL